MLRFDGLTLSYPDGTRALDGVSFAVPRGQFCVVLGASGAGKSTLLRTCNGLAAPTGGWVEVAGLRVERGSLPQLRRRIGMIHQQFNLTPRLDVATNVLCGALPAIPTWRALLGLFPASLQRRAFGLIAEVGLDEAHLRRRASDLSGGQQQRVAVARAFMLSPDLILADEPVASLDPRISREVLDLLKRQAGEQGATVLCSLHQIDLALAFADRIVALKQGRVVFDGTPDAATPAVLSAVYAARELAGAQGGKGDVVHLQRAG